MRKKSKCCFKIRVVFGGKLLSIITQKEKKKEILEIIPTLKKKKKKKFTASLAVHIGERIALALSFRRKLCDFFWIFFTFLRPVG